MKLFKRKTKKKAVDLIEFDEKIKRRVKYCTNDEKTHHDTLTFIQKYVSIRKYVKIELEDLTITLFSFFKYMLIWVSDDTKSSTIFIKKIEDGKDNLYFKGDPKSRTTSDYLMVLIFINLMEEMNKDGIC